MSSGTDPPRSHSPIGLYGNGESDSTLLRELNLNSVGGSSLNDSAAFAASEPSTIEFSRRENDLGKKAILSSARRSLGGDAIKGKSHLTLRQQEKAIDDVKKENFNLKLKIYFLEERLAKLAPDQVDQAFKENIEIKVEFQTVRQELKRYKRLLIEAERAIEALKSERDEALSTHQSNNAITARRVVDRNLEDEIVKLRRELESERKNRDEAEKSFARAKSETHQLREAWKSQKSEEWDGEDARVEIEHLQREIQEQRIKAEEVLGERNDLRDQIIQLRDELDESRDRMASNTSKLRSESRLRASHHDDQTNEDDEFEGDSRRQWVEDSTRRNRQRQERKVDDLEHDISALKSQVNAQVTMLSTGNDEKNALQDEIQSLKRNLMELEETLDHREAELRQRSREGQEHQVEEALQEELNEYRDKLNKALLDLDQREKDVDELAAEIEDAEGNFQQQLEKNDDRFHQQIEQLTLQRDEFHDVIEEREDQIRELGEKLSDLIAMQEESEEKISKLEQQVQKKEEELMAVADELEATQADLKEIGAGNRGLADELQQKEDVVNSLTAELDELETELRNRVSVHEEVTTKLKQKHSSTKSELNELTIQHESSQTEVKFLRDQVEDLAMRHAEMEQRRNGDVQANRRLEDQVADLERDLRNVREDWDNEVADLQKEKKIQSATMQQTLDAKQKIVSASEADLAQIKGRLQAREDDLEKLQAALRSLESESNKLNESQSNDRFSLELEIERLQRDLSRMEDDLDQARLDGDKAQGALEALKSTADRVRTERDDLKEKLAKIQRVKKDLDDKFEEQSKTLRHTQGDLSQAREQLQSAEDDMLQDQKKLSKTEGQYQSQLSERNTLLLTIYQYMEKLISNGAAPRKSVAGDAKSFSNFSIFSDNILSRLKTLSALQSGFDTRIKDFETKVERQYGALKRQQDQRLRQLDGFEQQIKLAAHTQSQWKQRVQTKQVEVDVTKATCSELQQQINSLKQRASLAGLEPGSITEGKQAQTKAANLERRLLSTQSALKSAETKLEDARMKLSNAESNWQARLRELQERNRVLEEKVKREKQGAKERVKDLEGQVTGLKDQVASQDRRGQVLDEVMRQTGA